MFSSIRARLSTPGFFGLGLVTITWIIAFVAWTQHTPDALVAPSAYDLFPLFGLMAFSTLWSIYAVMVYAAYFDIPRKALASFYQTAGYAVLVLILAHPTALIARLYMDGFGLPPGSYGSYVNQNYVWVVYLGTLSLFIFLAFELHRWFSKKSWWKWVVYANDLAMLLVFYHGMTIGGELQKGWFKYVWWFYGLVLAASIIYLRVFAKRSRSSRLPIDT